ncbi:MAG: TRAP transporter fused permease subunit [Chloroflexota bacterium]
MGSNTMNPLPKNVRPQSDAAGEEQRKGGLSRYWLMPLPFKIIFITSSLAALVIFILFWFSIPVFGNVLTGVWYYYILYATLGFNIFLGVGATKAQKRVAPRWYDYLLGAILWGIIIYCLINHEAIGNNVWINNPTPLQFTLGCILALLALECGRRVGGWGFVGMLAFAIIYPLVCGYIPTQWPISGFPLSFQGLITDYAFGDNGMLGLPARILGHLVIGFYFFAGMMMGMGGGEFFLKLAVALAGKYRGGPAKVAVISSAFFGSLSGSVIANIAGTGGFTIPAMKRMGYEPEYAAAVEACASTGGDTMPPIMGGIFIMIIIAQVEYADVLVAAIIPSLLYFYGLLVQVDGYAATHGLRGLPKNEIPPIGKTLKDGWLYLLIIAFLVFGLVYMRWGVIVPVYAVFLVLILSFFTKRTRLTWRTVEGGLAQYAGLLNFGTAIFLPMGFFMVGLLKTGMAGRLTAWIVGFGGENVYLILLIGVLFSLAMGTVGLDRTSYLFLAVTMAPAVIKMTGLPTIAVHLFLIMYGGMGGLTPPVAIHAYIAAGIAGADPVKTSYRTVRLGIILAIFPFFFLLQPALIILNSSPLDILKYLSIAMVGLGLLASGLEGHLFKVGRLSLWQRCLLIPGGFLFAFPDWSSTIVGVVMCAAAITPALVRKRLTVKTG